MIEKQFQKSLYPIKITFNTPYKQLEIPANLISDTLSYIDQFLINEEIKMVEYSVKEIIGAEAWSIIEKPLYNSARRTSSWQILSAHSGSIIVIGAVTACVSWVLLNTLGETFKEAWKESEMHEKLKALLLTKIGKRSLSYSKRLEHTLIRHIHSDSHKIEYDLSFEKLLTNIPSSSSETLLIEVTITKRKQRVVYFTKEDRQILKKELGIESGNDESKKA